MNHCKTKKNNYLYIHEAKPDPNLVAPGVSRMVYEIQSCPHPKVCNVKMLLCAGMCKFIIIFMRTDVFFTAT